MRLKLTGLVLRNVVCAPCLQEAKRAVLWHRSHPMAAS